MKIMVMSPRHGTGLTTVASLMADICSRKLGNQCILTHTGSYEAGMSRYLTTSKGKDNLMNIHQIFKLLEVGDITGKDIKNYTILKGKLGIFDIYTENKLENEQRITKLLTKVFDEYSSGLAFIDVADELYSENLKEFMETASFFIIVITQSIDVISQFRTWMESTYWETIKKTGFIVIVNRFDKNIQPVDKIAKELGIRRSQFAKISYNPFITKQANNGKLLLATDFALSADYRYVELRADLIECIKIFTSNIGIPYRWRD